MKLGLHRLWGRRRGAIAFAAVFIIAWAGCVSLQPTAAMPVPVARVAVANRTDQTWDIVLRSTTEGRSQAERIAPRSIAQWNLPEGDYVIEQSLAEAADPGATKRTFPVKFVAGVDYKWSLATLQSVENSEPVAAAH